MDSEPCTSWCRQLPVLFVDMVDSLSVGELMSVVDDKAIRVETSETSDPGAFGVLKPNGQRVFPRFLG